jgi:WD40 repeat protein/transcriptional regulator with XRE-family HTH domain
MLTLRTEIGLTQAALASLLGVSRRAVGDWEAGNSYPKAEHLKELITLAVKNQAFTTENAAEEIRALWKAARQKVLLDESWLSSLLSEQRSPHLHIVPKPTEESTISGQEALTVPTAPGPRVDWGDALTTSVFYGREEELAELTQWVLQERCRVVSVLGMGGIGKSALSVSIMHRLAGHFEVVIFRSLRDAPSCEVLLAECLQTLSPQSLSTMPATLEQSISLLLSHLRKVRVLLVLDNLESLLQEGDVRGRFRSGFEGYGQLLRRVAETIHQSCLLITSREKPAALRPLEGKHSPVRSSRLTGLDAAACKQLLVEKEVVGTEPDQQRLIGLYGGNPLALKIVAETIVDLFGGEIGPFLTGETVLFGSITDLLGEQFARLSALEKSVLCWLAIMREPVTLDELLGLFVTPLPRAQVLEALDAGHRRSLIESGKRPGSFTLESVVLEYVTAFLIAKANREIQQHQLDQLIEHGLSQATAREYVRQTQERLLLSPLLEHLQNAYLRRADGAPRGSAVTTDPTPVEELLLSLLDQLRAQADSVQGYGPANLIALLRLQRGNLNGLDLSHLSIRGASLQGIEMQNTSLSGALIRDTVWTSAVSATWGVAISQDGTMWATSGMQGEVRIWRDRGQTLHFIWRAHTDIAMALAFSPNGRMLATGSVDRTVKLWDVEACSRAETVGMPLAGTHSPYAPHNALLWMDWQNNPQTLAFSPDSSLLVCSGLSTTVRLWDAQSGTALQSLEHPAHVSSVTWSPDGRLLASACFDGRLRLWARQEAQPSTCTEILRLSTSWETSPAWSLAFSPDSRTLVSTGWEDRKVKLWEVGSGRLLHTFEGETSQMNKVAWSPDGRTLAICSYENAIRVFDVEQRRQRATLSGHTSYINGMAFTPDSHSLLSGSADGTLRVWDVESGECMRVIAGYAVSLYGLDWSPDGTHLVRGGTDGCVSIWDLSAETPPRELRGHTGLVSGVGWSPDGKFVASSGWDTVMRLWNPTSLTCVRIFRDPSTTLLDMAWSPDGSLLAVGTFLQGMYVWDVKAGRPRWIGEPNQTAFLSTAWSPDGSLLAGGSDDGNVYLWESADGTRQQKLSGHQGNITSLAWSPDGRLLASGSEELFVWEVQTRRGSGLSLPVSPPMSHPMQTFARHPGIVYALAWSPNGKQLISGGSDGLLRWWDVQSGVCVSMQEAHHGTIRSLKASPDGKFLASCGDDGAIRIWDLCSGGQAQGTVPTAPPLLRTLRRDRPYERLNISGIRGLTEAQKSTLQALGAIL